jgi:hypothetical protein
MINTDMTWKCRRDNSYAAKEPMLHIHLLMSLDPWETSILIRRSKNWKNADFDRQWLGLCQQVTKACRKECFGYGLGWMLVPRTIRKWN